MVQSFVKEFITKRTWFNRNKTLFVFTGLCITPVQWFNYNVVPVVGKNVLDINTLDDIERFWADKTWLDYHKFLIEHSCINVLSCEGKNTLCIPHKHNNACPNHHDDPKIEFHRHLLTVEEGFPLVEKYSFPHVNVVESQLNKIYISCPNGELAVARKELPTVAPYKDLPAEAEKAYLMSNTLGVNYKTLGEVFANYFQPQRYCNIVTTNNVHKITNVMSKKNYWELCQNNLPSDFIIFGYKENNNTIIPLFGLGCDVSADKARLRLITNRKKELESLTDFVQRNLLR
jgi:hypothetical protein